MKIAQMILQLRREKGFTQEQLAEMLDVSTAAVSKWECANTYPDITLLPKLAGIFGVSVDYLLGHEDLSAHTVDAVVREAKSLRINGGLTEAEALLARTLARFPGNVKLTYELAYSRFLAARSAKKSARDRLLNAAADGFRYVTEQASDGPRLAWSTHFLTAIALLTNDIDTAASYNAKLLPPRGLFPRVSGAAVGYRHNGADAALPGILDSLYDTVGEYAGLLPWLSACLLEKGEYDRLIRELSRAVKVCEAFADERAEFLESLAFCHETLALAYAKTEDPASALEHLENACAYCMKHDRMPIPPGKGRLCRPGRTGQRPEKSAGRPELRRTRGIPSPVRQRTLPRDPRPSCGSLKHPDRKNCNSFCGTAVFLVFSFFRPAGRRPVSLR